MFGNEALLRVPSPPPVTAEDLAERERFLASASPQDFLGWSRLNSKDVLHLDEDEARTRLKLISMLGQGGFAEVFKASFDGTTVALKLVTMPAKDRAEQKKRLIMFFREARALKACQHPNICGFYGLVKMPRPHLTGVAALKSKLQTERGTTWGIIQEYIDGGSLAKLIGSQMASPHTKLYHDRQALQWCLEVANGLAYMHSQTLMIIHRDVKPENVLLKTVDAGKRAMAKLVDLGLHVLFNEAHERLTVFRAMKTNVLIPRAEVDMDKLQLSESGRKRLESVAPGALSRSGSGNLPASTSRQALPPVANMNSMSARVSVEIKREEVVSASASSNVSASGSGDQQALVSGRSNSVTSTVGGFFNKVVADERVLYPPEDGEEFTVLFSLTGKTGSILYMAPEVYKEQPYNEKIDVYSFGMVMFELFTRSLVMYSQTPGRNDADATAYAERVAQGHRPSKPKKMPESVWALISACWAQDSETRPNMSVVVAELKRLLDSAPEFSAKAMEKDCVIC